MTRLQDLRAAIVDLDGTLVHTLGDFHVAVNAMLADLGAGPLDRGQVEPMVGRGSEHLIRSALQAAGVPAQAYKSAWTAYQRHYGEVNGRHSSVYPGVDEGLRHLRSRGWRLACLTNKPVGFARVLLRAKGLDAHFEAVFGGDSFERKKPDPLPVLRTCEALGSAPSRTLVVGDSRNDAAAGQAAGCPVVLVTYGYNHGRPAREVAADGHLDSLGELAGWLAGAAA